MAGGTITSAPQAARSSTAWRFTFSNITLPMQPGKNATVIFGLLASPARVAEIFAGNTFAQTGPLGGSICSILRNCAGSNLNRPIFRSS